MRRKLGIIALLTVMLLTVMSACAKPVASVEILTQKSQPKDKLNITVMVKHAFSIRAFETAVEKKFPNVNLIQVGNYAANLGIDEYQARLEHDDLTDIVMTWPLDAGKEYWDDRLIDLSSFEYSSRYNAKSLNDISFGQDGKLYYLPGPSQLRGIVYNKTLFEEKGWSVPNSFEGFLTLCQAIENTDLDDSYYTKLGLPVPAVKDKFRSLQLGLKNPEVFDTAFVGYGYGASYSTLQNARLIANYNEGIGSFEDNYRPALETYQRLIESGVLKREDLDINYAQREKMISDRRCVMVEDSVLLANSLQVNTNDEYGLMPFFNPTSTSSHGTESASPATDDWARLYPVCFIGLNKHLLEKNNKTKFECVQNIMNYISTPEGQAALLGDNGAAYSTLKNMPPPEVDETIDLIPALAANRCGVFPTLKNAQSALRSGLRGMLKDGKSIEDVIKMVDEQNIAPLHNPKPLIVGQATKDFTMVETGQYVTDVMRNLAGSDVALYLDNGKDGRNNSLGLGGRFYKGDITRTDLNRILSITTTERQMVKVKMTGANLIKTLEYAPVVLDYTAPPDAESGFFYYFSGLKMEFDPTAAPGKRIKKITDSKGNSIIKSKIYTVAAMKDSILANNYTDSVIMTNTIKDNNGNPIVVNATIELLIDQAIARAHNISPSNDGRLKIVSTL